MPPTPPATGPTPALATGGGGAQIGDGNLGEVQLRPQGAQAAFTGTATLAAADITGGIVTYSGAGHTLTLPLATDLDAAVPNARVNSSFDFSVAAIGAGTATVATNTGWTIVGTLTVATTTVTRFRARKTAPGAWTLYQIG